MSNGEALERLREYTARVRAFPELGAAAAPEVAGAVQAEIGANVAAGIDPYGAAWPATKDGRAPLQNASKAVRVRALGDVVLVVLEGIEVRHHVGSARGYHGGSAALGGFRRPIIFDSRGLPPSTVQRIKVIVADRFQHGGRP